MPLFLLFLFKNTTSCINFLQFFCSSVYLAVYKKQVFCPVVAEFMFFVKVSHQNELMCLEWDLYFYFYFFH